MKSKFRFDSITGLWDYLVDCIYLNSSPKEKYTEYNNFYQTTSCEFDFDLSQLGYTKSKWTMFLGQYVERKDLLDFIGRVKSGSSGEIGLVMGKRTIHTNGPCVFGLSLRLDPVHPSISLYSRSAILLTRGCLELALVSQLSHLLNRDFEFNWYVGEVTWWGPQLIPYLIYNDKLGEYIEGNYKLSRSVANLIDKGSEFISIKRLLTRGEQIKEGIVPPLPSVDLPFIWRCDDNKKKRISLDGKIYSPGKYPEDFKLTPGMLPHLKKRKNIAGLK